MEKKSIEYNAEAARFIKFREKLQLSQTEIAKILETKQPNISKIEKGERPLTFTMLRILRKKYSLNINWYISGEGTMLNQDEKKSTLISDIGEMGKDISDIYKLLERKDKNINYLFKVCERMDEAIARLELKLLNKD